MTWLDRIFPRRRARRAEVIGQPLPPPWLRIIRRSVPSYESLSARQQRKLCECVQIFVAEKQFLGTDNLEITDEVKVTVAAPACLLVIGIPELDVYPRLREIIMHPHAYGEVVEAIGPDGTRYRIPNIRAGEAWRRGPVVLAWDSVRRSIASPCDGYNVVFHEFAHVLDMQAGVANGAPPLESREQEATWSRVFNAEYEAFVEANRRGRPTLLNPYGCSHPAEFFAVVTEHFFEQPRQLRARHRELYAQLRLFYRQDPAEWRPASSGS